MAASGAPPCNVPAGGADGCGRGGGVHYNQLSKLKFAKLMMIKVNLCVW